MRLLNKIEAELSYPEQLEHGARFAQKEAEEMFSDRQIDLEDFDLFRHFTCNIVYPCSYIFEQIFTRIAHTHLDDIQEPALAYSLDDIFEILQSKSDELVNEILSLALVKKPGIKHLLIESIVQKDKNKFIEILVEEECDLINVKKILYVYDIKETLQIILQTKQSLTLKQKYAEKLCTSISGIYGNESGSDPLINELNNLIYESNEKNLREIVLTGYALYVKQYFNIVDILDETENRILLKYLKSPEYEILFNAAERGFYAVPNDCPFTNITIKQLNLILEFLREKATHKAGNKAKNKNFCRGEVLDTIVALKLLGIYVVPKNDNHGLKDLTCWLDENVPHSDLSKPENQYRVNEYLRNSENEDRDTVKKIIKELKDIGIS